MSKTFSCPKMRNDGGNRNLASSRFNPLGRAWRRWPVLLAVLAATGAAPGFTSVWAEAESLSAEQLQGCWKYRDVVIRRQSVLCFRTDGTVYYSTSTKEGGGDRLFKWSITVDGDLIINRQTCDVDFQQRSDQRILFLLTCVYMGTWIQTCTLLEADGLGCATKD